MKRYTESHEWVDENGKVGVTAHALGLLGDVVFIELPEIDAELKATESVAVIESHKAASDIYAPVSGTVSAVNEAAVDTPDDINGEEDLWLFDVKDATSSDHLMDDATYAKFIESEA